MSTSQNIYLRMLPIVAALSLAHWQGNGEAQTLGEVTTTVAVGQTVDSAGSSVLPVGTILDKAQQAANKIQQGNAQTEALLKEIDAPTLTPEQQAQLNVGRKLLDEKQFKEAQIAFETSIALNYRNYDAHFGLGLTLLGQGDLVGARFEFTQLTQLLPGRMEGHYNLGVVLTRLGQNDEAIAAFSEAIKVGKGKALPSVLILTYRSLAALQAAKGAYADAAKTLGEALTVSPGDANLSLALADALYQSSQKTDKGKGNPGEIGNALGYAYTALTQDPKNVQAVLLIADIYAGQGLSTRALRELDRSLTLELSGKEYSLLLFKRAQILLGQGDKTNALKVLESATKADPSNTVAQYQLGKLALESKMWDEALTAFTAAQKQNPKSPEITLALALVLDAKGEAAAAYKNAMATSKLTSDPTYLATANLVAGKNAYRSKQFQIAEKLLQTATSAEGLLWLGLSHYALKDYAASVTAFETAIKLDPDNTVLKSNLGASYLATGKYNEAQAVLETLVKVNPKNAEAWYNLGWTLRNLGRDTDAKAAFKQSANLGYALAQKELKAK